MKYTVLTYNFGGYELLRQPKIISPNCEYICVTDNINQKNDKWKLIHFNKGTALLNTFYVKFHPFDFCDTDYCIVIDGSMLIKKPLDILIEDFIKSNADTGVVINHRFLTLKEELDNWVNNQHKYIGKEKNKIMSQKTIEKFYKLLLYHNMNNYKGCISAGFKICKKTDDVIHLYDEVFQHQLFLGDDEIARDDQLIIPILLEKHFPNIKCFIMNRQIFSNDYISYCMHNSLNPITPLKINLDNLYFKNEKQNKTYSL